MVILERKAKALQDEEVGIEKVEKEGDKCKKLQLHCGMGIIFNRRTLEFEELQATNSHWNILLEFMVHD
ncbi:hypothetical protein L1887_24950 [Cichorium endivia]|nr:hypothetical protein L1887_24950 [Cichorium endivia]